MSPQAKAHYDRGLDLYAARQYAAAIDELQLGHAIEPRREFLFAEAQAYRLAGNCAQAIPLYREFIQSAPTALQMQAATLGLNRCDPDRSPAPRMAAAPVATTPMAAKSTPQAAVQTATRDARPWWRDPWAGAAIGAGAVALGLAAGFEVASEHARDQARSPETTTDNQYDRVWATAQQRRKVAVIALIGGTVLLATGGARLLFLRGRVSAEAESITPRLDPRVSFSIGDGSAALTWWSVF
jgi:tetratricopeptide (TPR) repeat protein